MSTFDINRVLLIGRLTKDPELRSLPSGVSVCGLRIACNSSCQDAEGDYHEKPNYFDVSVFGAHAENVNSYMRKGRRVMIDGRLEWREWQTPDQQRLEAVSVVADTVLFLDSPSGQGGGEPGDGDLGDEIDQDFDQEIDQISASELGLRPASELVRVGASAEEDDLLF
jgi:single-strand DNA-binding protein